MFRLTRLKGGMLKYRYDCPLHGPDVACEFHMLCEVGTPYQQQFIDEISRRGWKVETRELDQAPWVADFVTNYRGERHEKHQMLRQRWDDFRPLHGDLHGST